MEQPYEEMAAFFDVRAKGYNEHMLSNIGEGMYLEEAAAFPETGEEIRLLDLGCGTGIELSYLFRRMPNARVTCVDLSGEMLRQLVQNFPEQSGRIELVQASYLDWEYPAKAFDRVLSSQTMHHFERDCKAGIYRNILKCLRPSGCYVEADFMVDAPAMAQYRERYERLKAEVSQDDLQGKYHIDIPFTVEIQQELLLQAGFARAEVLYSHIRQEGSYAILRAWKE